MNTVPNQKTVTIHKDRPKSDFLQISNDHWMDINKKLGPYALQLYLYLAKNADSYHLALSQQAAENEAGIKRTTFHKYVDLLIAEGYLVKRTSGSYDFYETPREQEKESLSSPSYGEPSNSQNVFENPSPESDCLSYDLKLPQRDIEIDKRQVKDNKKIKENILQQEEEIRKIAEATRNTRTEFVF